MIPAEAVEFKSIVIDYSWSTYVDSESDVQMVVSK